MKFFKLFALLFIFSTSLISAELKFEAYGYGKSEIYNLSEENINSPITREQLQNEIKQITNNEMFLEKRINEQLYTGYLEEVNGEYILTNRIKNFVSLQNLISVLFNTN